MIKILAIIPSPEGAVSFYRGLGPLLRLEKDYPGFIQIDFGGVNFTWPDLYPYDIVFNIRPDSNEHLELIRRARRMGKRIWTDWDDLLWDMPIHHPLSPRYSDPKVQKTIAESMSLSDVNTFSTRYLEHRAVEDFGLSNTRLIINAIDFEVQKPAKSYQGGENFLWRGSNTHDYDLYVYKDAIINSTLKHDRHIHFHGSMPFFIFTETPLYLQYGFADIPQYLENIRIGNKYRYMLIPLAPSNFNKAKSNIAALEAITAGIIPIVPNTEGWDVGFPYQGVVNMSECIDFLEGESEQARAEIWAEEMVKVKEKYDLRTQNNIRKNIIKDLVSWVEQ